MRLAVYHGRIKPAVAIGKHQCRLLEFAVTYPGWHSFTQDRTTKRAVTGLRRRGCIEVIGDQFRFPATQERS